MSAVVPEGQSSPGPDRNVSGRNRLNREMAVSVWAMLLLVAILFTIATAGIGAFFVGIVLIWGIVLTVLTRRKS